MNDNKRPPVIVPFAMVHIGIFGMISAFFAFFQDDFLISRIGASAFVFSSFVIFAGLLAIRGFRQRPEQREDAIAALNALSIFILPLLTLISIPLQVIMCAIGLFFFAPITTIAIQSGVRHYSTVAAKNYCILLRCREPKPLKWIFFVLLTLINWSTILFGCFIMFAISQL